VLTILSFNPDDWNSLFLMGSTLACALWIWNMVCWISDATGVGTLSVTRTMMMRSQNARSSLLTFPADSFTRTSEFLGTPPQFRFQGSHVTMVTSS
jgi:hypothetical protein